ncbi:MAG: hypothetical protein GY719_20910 [bacterium]|nr:hypothetical protein [bacterium]
MSDKGRFPGCLKYGCVGCLSILALFVVLIFLVSAIHLASEPQESRPEQRQAEHPLPETPLYPTAPDAPQVGEILPLPELPEYPDQEAPVGRVVLDLRMGEFVIRPGPAGEPIRVEADYDAGTFELREEFQSSEDGGWVYEVGFGARRGWLDLIFSGAGENVNNEVEIIIPRGHRIDLVGEVGMGEFEADLSGLWLRKVDLELGTGDHFVEFRDPLPFPMETFRADSSMGSVEIRGLGEASPVAVEVAHSMGELFLDLKGHWRDDATVEVELGIGSCRVWLPEDARIDYERTSSAFQDTPVERPRARDLPDDAPTLTLDLRTTIGELDIEY